MAAPASWPLRHHRGPAFLGVTRPLMRYGRAV